MSKLTLNKRRYLYKNWNIQNISGDQDNFCIFRYHRLFFGSLIKRGRKDWALKFLIETKFQLKKRLHIDPNFILHASLLKITPHMFLIPKKMGSSVYGVPVSISFRKQLTFSVKWVVKLLRDKFRRLIVNHVADCLVGSLFNKGLSFERKSLLYKTADENRHLLRYMK